MNLTEAVATRGQGDMKGTLVVDMDGVLVDFLNCKEGCSYEGFPDPAVVKKLKRTLCPVMEGAREILEKWKYVRGYRIVIQTGRVESEREVTLWWLRLHKIPFDELIMDKSRGIIYIDDLGYQFKSWEETDKEIEKRRKVHG